jgi:glycosyltransferase involved in cell wall biosynthesis
MEPGSIKLLYLCHDSFPSFESRTEQIVQSMSALSAHGFETKLVIPETAVGRSAAARAEEIRRFYGLPAKVPFPEGVIEYKPWLDLRARLGPLSADIQAVQTARRVSPDIVYTRDTWALALAVLSALPVIFETYRSSFNELRRFWPLRRIIYQQRNLLGIVTHSRYALRSFAESGVEEARLHLGYNGYDPGSLLPVCSMSEARTQLGFQRDTSLVVYTGHVHESKGTQFLLSLAALAPEVTFVILGAIPGSRGEREFEEELRRGGLENVRLLARVPPRAVAPYLYAASCLLIPPTASPLREYGRTVLPMKLFNYMAAGRPILAPDLPDVREVLRDGSNAILVPPDDPEKAVGALRLLLTDPARGASLAERAREDARAYTWEARAGRLAAFIRQRYRAWQGQP